MISKAGLSIFVVPMCQGLGFLLNCCPESAGLHRACLTAFLTIINTSQVMPELFHRLRLKERGIRAKWAFGGWRCPEMYRHVVKLEKHALLNRV